MTKEQKIIRAKVGLLELAKQLGNVSQAFKMMGYITATQGIATDSPDSTSSWIGSEDPPFAPPLNEGQKALK
jgi:hypothetical protein